MIDIRIERQDKDRYMDEMESFTIRQEFLTDSKIVIQKIRKTRY